MSASVARGRHRIGHRRDDGSATVVVAAVIAVLLVLSLGAADVAKVLAAAARAQTAADAASLAAAQTLAIPDGGPPSDAARTFAERNGATLGACECEPGTFVATVTVHVAVPDLLLVAGGRTVVARARAQVDLPSH